uniref:DNA2/NAM7 helicase-like C-terminal domain-containing protein n=1 Tax=Leersia perrieri TaxID=77586 RepID=A0A0D9XUS6_9ORYZ
MGRKQRRRKGTNKDAAAAAQDEEPSVGDDAGEAAGGGDGPTAAAGGGGRPASTAEGEPATAEDAPPAVAQSTPPSPPALITLGVGGNTTEEKAAGVQKVPTKFNSLQQYLSVHSNLLLDEIRRNIKSSLLEVATAQCYHALSVSFAGSSSTYYIDVDLSRLDGCQHVVADGDLFFLSSEPSSDHLSGCFGIATDVGCDNRFHRSFKVFVSENQKESDLESIKYVSFLTNIMEEMNISKALVSIASGDVGIINSILRHNEKCNRTYKCAESCAHGFGDCTYLEKYNEEQQSAMTSIISKVRCRHNNSVELVWGPPGTGKTRIAIGLIKSLLNLKSRMLVCVPRERDIPRFLNYFKKIHPSFKLQQILVLNDLRYNDICDTLSETILANKASKLYVAMFVWKGWVKEMAGLLRLDIYCRKKCMHHDEYSTCSKCEPIEFSFISFREKIENLHVELRKCSVCLINSPMLLSDLCVENINNLLGALSEFESLMQKDAISDSSVKRVFGLIVALDPDLEDCCTTKSLNQLRRECLGLTEIVLSSIELPDLDGWSDLEDFCIKQSHIIISTPVDKAAQITESDLLIPLSIPPRHIVLLGDHLHLLPTGRTKGSKEAGFSRSLFQRLLHLSFERHMLIKQYMMDPSIIRFPNELFYKDKVVDGQSVELCDYNNQPINLQFAAYTFFDIAHMEDFSCKGKKPVEAAAILFLLQKLSKGLTNAKGRVNVGIVCLCTNQVNTIINQLGTEYQNNNRINLEVNSIENMNEDWYDVIILSSHFDDKSELPMDNRINVALTKSRYCLWIIGQANILLQTPGTWQKLVQNAVQRKRAVKLDSKILAMNIETLSEITDRDGPVSAHSTTPKKNMVKNLHGQEDHITLNTFCHVFETKRVLQSQYEHQQSTEIGLEEKSKKGKRRLETVLDMLKVQGVIGSNEVNCEDSIFKISAYNRVNVDVPENIISLLENGNVMIGCFRLSYNYFYLNPGQIYCYDQSKPYIHPKSNIPASHAVVVIGHGKRLMGHDKGANKTIIRRHVAIQNSEGKRFGFDGTGRVYRRSLRQLYQLKL